MTPQYRWTLADFSTTAPSAVGLELSATAAKSALLLAINRAGGLRHGMLAQVHRPSGGGWRAVRAHASAVSWEEWGAP